MARLGGAQKCLQRWIGAYRLWLTDQRHLYVDLGALGSSSLDRQGVGAIPCSDAGRRSGLMELWLVGPKDVCRWRPIGETENEPWVAVLAGRAFVRCKRPLGSTPHRRSKPDREQVVQGADV